MSIKDNKFDQLFLFIKNTVSPINYVIAAELISKVKEIQASQCHCGAKMGAWCACGQYVCAEHHKARHIYRCTECHESICNTCGDGCEKCEKGTYCIPCLVKHECNKCRDCGVVLRRSIYGDGCTQCSPCRIAAENVARHAADEAPVKKSRVEKRKK